MKVVAHCPVLNKIQLNQLAALPPTSAAAREHSFRVYHQVQQRSGVELPPTEWGWELINGQLQPVLTRQLPAPEKLLTLISCNCKSGCERFCDCKMSGLFYTTLCGDFYGNGCSNSEKQSFFIQTLMESITLMQKRAKTISVPIHYHTQMKHLISR